MLKRRAMWFSRHHPTAEQFEDALSNGWQITNISDGIELGSIAIQTQKDCDEVLARLWASVLKTDCEAVCGVFPAPLQSDFCRREDSAPSFPCFASWNIARSVAGGKPTFTHFKWVPVGYLT